MIKIRVNKVVEKRLEREVDKWVFLFLKLCGTKALSFAGFPFHFSFVFNADTYAYGSHISNPFIDTFAFSIALAFMIK